MNAFDIVFDQAVDDSIIEYVGPIEKEALRSLHNSGFNNWLELKYLSDLNFENYSLFCTYDNFRSYLKEYYIQNKKNAFEGVLSKIEKKIEVGLIPGIPDLLPDINLVVEDSETYLQFVQPHYNVFLSCIKRANFQNIKEYINFMFYNVFGNIRLDELVRGVELKTVPKTDDEIRELAQNIFSQAPVKVNPDYFQKIKDLEKNIGETTTEEDCAIKIVNIIILKLFINRFLVAGKDKLRKSFMKIFLMQYLTEYTSILNLSLPIELTTHINNIRAPQFDIALNEYLKEKNLTLQTHEAAVTDKNDLSKKTAQPNITTQNINNFYGTNHGSITQTPVTNSNSHENQVTANVAMESKKSDSKTKKPNWVIKAIVLGIIGLVISLIGYFVKVYYDDGKGKSDQTIQLP